MGIVAVVLLIIAYSQGDDRYISGLKFGGKLFLEIIPLLVFAFIIAGMIQVLVPSKVIAKWVGEESGIRGIIIGTFVGGLTPGGPYVSLPIMAGFMHAGAGIGTMVAYITGWSLIAIGRLPYEIGILGWKFTAIRLACTAFLPIIAGILANILFSNYKT